MSIIFLDDVPFLQLFESVLRMVKRERREVERGGGREGGKEGER